MSWFRKGQAQVTELGFNGRFVFAVFLTQDLSLGEKKNIHDVFDITLNEAQEWLFFFFNQTSFYCTYWLSNACVYNYKTGSAEGASFEEIAAVWVKKLIERLFAEHFSDKC